MDFERKDIWIGAVVLLAAMVLLGALFAVNKNRMMSGRYRVEIRLPSIAGLARGSEVVYRGYRAGEVDHISVSYEPEVLFTLRLQLSREIMLRRGSIVVVKAKGLAGAKFLELTPPAAEQAQGWVEDGETLKAVPEPDLMASAQNAVSGFQRMLGDMEKGNTAANVQAAAGNAKLALASLDAALRTTNSLLSENRAALKATLEETRGLTAETRELLAKKQQALSRILDNLDASLTHLPSIMMNVEELTADLKKHPWRLVRKGDETPIKVDHNHPQK